MGFWKAKGNESDGSESLTSGGKNSSAEVSATSRDIHGMEADSPSVVSGFASRSPREAAPSPAEIARTSPSAVASPVGNPDDPFERYGKIRSALGPGTVIQGKLSFDTPVRIDGKLSGEVFSSKALIVGPQGWIDAQIEVAVLVVFGSVKGNVRATERVELHNGARLEGDIIAPIFTMADGAIFNGRCAMPNEAAKTIEVKSSSDSKGTSAKSDRSSSAVTATTQASALQ